MCDNNNKKNDNQISTDSDDEIYNEHNEMNKFVIYWKDKLLTLDDDSEMNDFVKYWSDRLLYGKCTLRGAFKILIKENINIKDIISSKIVICAARRYQNILFAYIHKRC